MDRIKLFKSVIELMQQVSDNLLLTIDEDTHFDEIENWDSLNTVDLEMDAESKFNIEFDAGEFQNYRNVGELLDAITDKLS